MSRCDLRFFRFSVHFKQALSLKVSCLSLTMRYFILLFFLNISSPPFPLFSPSELLFAFLQMFEDSCLCHVCIFNCFLACLYVWVLTYVLLSASCGSREEVGHTTSLGKSLAFSLDLGTPIFFWGIHASWVLPCW